MNPPASASTSGRCGMCGACGTMPPWAPEMLKNTPPEARRALERRMQQAQTRFIEERDARRKAAETSRHDHYETPLQQELPNGDASAERLQIRHDGERDSIMSEKLPEYRDKLAAQHVSSPELSAEPQIEPNSETDLEPPNNSALLVSDVDVEDDASVEIPLDSAGIPPLLPSDNKSPQMKTLNQPEEYRVPQHPRRKLPHFSSPTLQESPVPLETPEPQALPGISLEPNQLSEPLRTISLRDTDSDADSFHTAEGEEMLRRSWDRLSMKGDEETENKIAPIVSEVEWQAFQDAAVVSESKFSPRQVSESPVSENAISLTGEAASLEGQTSDATNSAHSLSKTESDASQPSVSLEGSVITARMSARGPSSPQAQRDALMEDYALPTDLVRPNEIDLEPQRCQDCERWRERVRDLELKVEALTSALSAREMESASMRARSVDRRYHGKNEAQLMQECESLRVTTEYLYYKLERYERKLNGSHPDVH